MTRHTIKHDGFVGDVIGHYTTREGKRGVVLQQVGTLVVHVYGIKWLQPDTTGNAIAAEHASTAAGPVNCKRRLIAQKLPFPDVCDRCGVSPCPFFDKEGNATS